MRILRLNSEADAEKTIWKRKRGSLGEALPDREGKIPRIALAGPGQETAVDPPGQQELLCLDSGDVGVEPPEQQRNTGDKRRAC